MDLRLSNADGGCEVYKEDIGPPAGFVGSAAPSQPAEHNATDFDPVTTHLVQEVEARRPWVSLQHQ